jgi:hypothetical protein
LSLFLHCEGGDESRDKKAGIRVKIKGLRKEGHHAPRPGVGSHRDREETQGSFLYLDAQKRVERRLRR